ncbi:MAG: hypothetical protein GXY83_29035 [Rhodopirellula sp.]|nr:hypothetical protein [Rhodopirellula sp.]
MGANLRTFAARHASRDEVRLAVVSWLAAKGFDPCVEDPLFPFDPETERGVVLSETSGWIIVAFSHAYEEGDRLVFKLNKLHKPLLEVWVYDSDIWGYRLHDSSELVASFNSKPRYFGGPADLELARNGDPERLCEICQLGIEARQIAKLQRKWAVFAENVAERFCIEIGADTAAYDYQDFEELRLAPGQYITAGGIKIDRMFFVRRTSSDRQPALRLHEILLRAPPSRQIDPEIAAWQAEVQRQMLPLTVALRAFMWGARVVGWLFGPLFFLWWRWKGWQQMRSGRLLQELLDLGGRPEVERQGTRLVNRRHGCSIELPQSAEVPPDIGLPHVFQLRIGTSHIMCDALRPSRLREQLRIWPGTEVLEDEIHFIGSFPARTVRLRFASTEHRRHIVWHLVETSLAVYRFQGADEELSDDVRQQIRTAVESFRVEYTP